MKSSNGQRAFGKKAAFADYVKTSAIAVATAAPLSAMANFSGDYTVNPPANGVYNDGGATGSFGNWTGTWNGISNLNLNTTAAPAGIAISILGFNQGDGTPNADYTFLVTAAASGLVSFDYQSFVLTSGSSQFVGNIEFVNVTAGTMFSLNSGTMFSTGVSAGDIFGFHLSVGYQGDAGIAITNFFAPEGSSQGVPEQGYTLGLLAFGFVGLLAYRATAARRASVST